MTKKKVKKTAKKAKSPDVHIGAIFEGFIKREGLKKQFIADKLGVSRPWLNSLLKSGNFSPDRLLIIKKIMS